MSVDIDTQPWGLETTTKPGVVHLVCCDENLAICGIDVTDEPWVPNPTHRCVICLDLAGSHCGAPDCTRGTPP